MANEKLPHIRIEGFTQTGEYKSPKSFPRTNTQTRDRRIHGIKIKAHLEQVKSQFEALQEVELSEGIVRDDAIYVEFISDFNFEPVFNSLHSEAKSPNYQLLSIKAEKIDNQERFRVNVMLTEGGISHFVTKANEFISENTKSKGIETQTPKHNQFICNIETIQLATLEAFWNEPIDNPFPAEDELVWWEVWFRKKVGIGLKVQEEKVEIQLAAVNAEIATQKLEFPEHYIKLVKATSHQLSSSVFLLDSLSELRKPKETAEFFTNLTINETENAVDELKSRIVNYSDENSPVICLLDSGIQNQHPLLTDFTPKENLFSYKLSDWGTHDGMVHGGHGTGMAGLALYGDLTQAMSQMNNIEIYHQLESVKLINKDDPNKPELYGAITIECVNNPIASFPNRTRIYCMAVTDKDQAYHGRPSSWSASVDKIIFGNEEELLGKQLFFVSGGNVIIEKPDDYEFLNDFESVHDPAQAFNAISVGAFTDLDHFDIEEFPNSTLIAQKGGMSPSNSTSIIWERNWAIKPDLVMEGGNLINQEGNLAAPDSLQLLTTHKNYRTSLLQTFGDTSGATALAANFAIQLKNEHPDLLPETIRALMIHSCGWTNAMLGGSAISDVQSFSKERKWCLLRTFGYGVPNLNKAIYSAKNSLTLIAEKEISPFKKEGDVKFNEIHFFDLPWPLEVLQNELATVDVKLNITLSYFIEPNPGSRRYSSNFNYQSHSLRFNVISPTEDFETFEKRINKNAREDGEAGFSRESWIIKEEYRNKGSVHRDFIISSGAELATRNRIAVYPVTGWYKTRKKLEKYNATVRYSLIISIETDETGIDIYTPVMNQIPIEI